MSHNAFIRRRDLGRREWTCASCGHNVPERATERLTDIAKRAHADGIHKPHETEDDQ